MNEIIPWIAITLSALTLLVSFLNNWQIRIVHREANSMKDELVREVRTSSLAKGRLEEKERAASQDNH